MSSVEELVVNDVMYAATKVGRIENRLRHIDPRPIIEFKFNPGQEHYYSEYLRAQQCQAKLGRHGFEGLFGKPRQIGVSTLINWIGYHTANFEDAFKVTVIAHQREAVQNILAAVKRFYRYWPEDLADLQQPAETKSRSALELENGSRYVVHTANSEDAARSFACNFLHLSEYAHFANDSAIGAAMAMVPVSAHVFKESTANGQAGAFYEEWGKALYVHEVEAIIESGDYAKLAKWSGAYKFFFPWFKDPQNTKHLHPEEEEQILGSLDEEETTLLKLYPEITVANLSWRRWKIDQLRHEELNASAFFRQEFPSNDVEMFQATGGRVFDAEKLANMLEGYRRIEEELGHPLARYFELTDKTLPVETKYEASQLWVFEEPKLGKNYSIGVDVSQGLKTSDDSVVTVLDRGDGTRAKVVAIWWGKIGAHELGDVVTFLAETYNNAYVVPEANNMGIATARRLVENRYPYVYHREAIDSTVLDSSGGSFRFGFITGSGKSQGKKVLIARLAAAITDDLIDIPDKRVLKQLLEFENVDGELKAPNGKNDDAVISLALALWGHFVAAPPVRIQKVQPKSHLSEHDQEVWKSIGKAVTRWQQQNHAELKRQEAETAYFEARARGEVS